MRTPSRFMPDCPPQKPGVVAWLMLAVLMTGLMAALVYLACQATAVQLLLTAGGFAALWGWIARDVPRPATSLQALASGRPGESICGFARSFERRAVDTWVIRAVYEELQCEVQLDAFPIRASDSLSEQLLIDPDDLGEWLAPAIAQRTGRTLDGAERNPYWGKVRTASDLVLFFNGQPRTAAA